MKPDTQQSPIGAVLIKDCVAEKKVDDSIVNDSINVRSILVEIQQGLKNFNKHQDNYVIDLGSIPLSAAEREYLFEVLGHGEVDITLSSVGKSEIYETLFSGVWVIKHRDEQGQLNGMFIEIGDIPDIILSPDDERYTAAIKLQELINSVF